MQDAACTNLGMSPVMLIAAFTGNNAKGESDRRFPCMIDPSTGERLFKIGWRDGETTDPYDVLLYLDATGRRKIPFTFGDQMDFGRWSGIPLSSVYVDRIGADLQQEKSHTFHDYIVYDRQWFQDEEPHGYVFRSRAEFDEFTSKLQDFMRPWLFWQLTPQASKSSHAHMVDKPYFPCLVAEVLCADGPDVGPPAFKERDQFFRTRSSYRGPFIEWQSLIRRREKTGYSAPPGLEKRSPWGGKVVDAIFADCFAARIRALAEVTPFLENMRAQQIKSFNVFVSELELIAPPFVYEKLTAIILRCDRLPGDPLGTHCPVLDWLCEPESVHVISEIGREDGWSSTERLLVHLSSIWTERLRDRWYGRYQKPKNGIIGPESYQQKK